MLTNTPMPRLHPIARRTAPVLLTLALWSLLFWPLPLRMGVAIPYSAHHRADTVETQSLVPGDHLQLLYHFWLTRDMLAGGTRPFHNLYEFNDGDDDARKQIDPGYLPFSLVYAALSPRWGHAVGWNAAQLAAVLTALLFLLALARRHARSEGIALAASMLALCVPYQWTNLGAGSPTGFGMAWIPALALGLDLAVRDRSRAGGVLAGVALLCCYTSDLHCFFFGALLVPAWCLVAWVAASDHVWPTRREIFALVRALWPAALAGALAAAVARHLQSLYATTDVAAGRSVLEVLHNSPSRRALFGWILRGHDLHFQLGVALVTAIAVAAAAALWHTGSASARVRSKRPLFTALLLCGGIGAVLVLALGFNGPFDGLPIRVVRKLLPPYRMIRQPVKIYCLLPTLLAPLFAMGFGALWQSPHPAPLRRLAARSVVVFLVAAGIADAARCLRVGLCRLPAPNGAYDAVVRDAADQGKRPHILAIPLWPGDSAWSSLYEYHAMQGRIRMLNGYAPVRTEAYLQGVFRRFESVTQGRLTDDQAAALRGMGVTAVVLHEEFPEVVSPFPVGATRRRLADNPWLDLLEHDGSAWSFRLRDQPAVRTDTAGTNTPALFAPARWRRHLDSLPVPPDGILASTALRSPLADWPNARWLIRTRGDGKLRVTRRYVELATNDANAAVVDDASLDGGMFFARQTAGPASPTVTLLKRAVAGGHSVRWLAVPLGSLPNEGWSTPALTISALEGPVRVTDILLAAGEDWIERDAIRWPAADLFRGGLTITREGHPAGVVFRPDYDPADVVLSGPNLPLGPGRWRLSVEGAFGTEAAGLLRVDLDEREVACGSVGPHEPPLEFAVEAMEPLVLRFIYAAKEEIRLDSLVLERIASPERGTSHE